MCGSENGQLWRVDKARCKSFLALEMSIRKSGPPRPLAFPRDLERHGVPNTNLDTSLPAIKWLSS
jgi:hypothetical protein